MLGFSPLSGEPISSGEESTLTSVSSDLVCTYTIDATLASVSSDLVATYAILSSVSGDLVCTYSIDSSLTAINSDLVATYAIQSSVSSDLVCTYSILSNLDARYARPLSTVSPGAWLPSTGASLPDMIDESTADDSDYIYTASASTCEIGLNPVVDPGTSSGQVVRYRCWSSEGNGLTVTLLQGATEITSWVHAALSATPTTYAQTLSTAECDSITDYSNLRLEFTAV